MDTIYNLAIGLLNLITLAIIARALLSWFYPLGRDRWSQLLLDVTEPLLAPVRAVISRILPIPIDFSPIIIILLIQFLQSLLQRAYLGS